MSSQSPAPQVQDVLIEKAWHEVSRWASEGQGQIVRGMGELSSSQPALAAFLSEACEGLSEDAAELGFFAALVVWQAALAAQECLAPGRALREAAPGVIVAQFGKTQEWLGSMGNDNAILLDRKLADPNAHPEPYLLRYVSQAVFEASEDGLELSAFEQERLFVALQVLADTLISCFRM